ncbi:MAG: hypothetical protein ACRDF0_11645 [Candidatus Limnocylindria bacterium]
MTHELVVVLEVVLLEADDRSVVATPIRRPPSVFRIAAMVFSTA